MKLKSDFDIASFLAAVKRCSGEVIFITSQDDRLNLKSQLSKYIFIAVKQDSSLLTGSSLLLSDENDRQYLEYFLEA